MQEINVFVVDDHQIFLDGIVSLLEDEPFIKITGTAHNGKQAIDIISSRSIELIVTDLKMPVSDGFQLLLYLMKENFNIPVIVMTAFGTPEIENQLKEFQTFGYLEKPVDFQKLADKINEGLAKTQTGSLNGISLFSFLQLIHVEQKTCQLKVTAHEKEGILYFFMISETKTALSLSNLTCSFGSIQRAIFLFPMLNKIEHIINSECKI